VRILLMFCVIIAALGVGVLYIDSERSAAPVHRIAEEWTVNTYMRDFLIRHNVRVDSAELTFAGLTIVDSETAGFQDYEQSIIFEAALRSEKIFAEIFKKLRSAEGLRPDPAIG